MEISEIKRITELLQKVNCERIALISEVAKEMGVKKTALMQFIEDNPKLFKLGEKVKRTKNAQTTLGLVIKTVYSSAEENPETEEWIEVQKKLWEKKIHIGERSYYGCHEYWLIPEDSVENKEGKYRNTHGGWGDANYETVFVFNDDVKKAIEDYGWTTDFERREKKEEE